jgi:phage terminase Nu1 subunit (DNA packaging protein)
MEGLMWGAFVGGTVGMGQQILKEEFLFMKQQRVEKAEMKAMSHLHNVETLEDTFLELFEESEGCVSAKRKLDNAMRHIDHVIELYVNYKNQDATPHYVHAVAKQRTKLGLVCLRSAVTELVHAKKSVTRLNQARLAIENNVGHVLNSLHSLTLAKK